MPWWGMSRWDSLRAVLQARVFSGSRLRSCCEFGACRCRESNEARVQFTLGQASGCCLRGIEGGGSLVAKKTACCQAQVLMTAGVLDDVYLLANQEWCTCTHVFCMVESTL